MGQRIADYIVKMSREPALIYEALVLIGGEYAPGPWRLGTYYGQLLFMHEGGDLIPMTAVLRAIVMKDPEKA